uniref:Uncharacterized protein n=1 Tax=Trichogramma kaykai TaxID=54128 RepID=A0ABD2W016_9HYME
MDFLKRRQPRQGAATLLGLGLGLGRRRSGGGGPVGAAAAAPAHDGRSAVLDQGSSSRVVDDSKEEEVTRVLRKSSQFVSRGLAPHIYTRVAAQFCRAREADCCWSAYIYYIIMQIILKLKFEVNFKLKKHVLYFSS